MEKYKLKKWPRIFFEKNKLRIALVFGFILIAFSGKAQYEISGGMDFSKKVYNKPDKAIPDDLFTEADFKLYPNPAKSVIKIQTDISLKEGVVLTLVDACGNILEKRIITQDMAGSDLFFNMAKYSNGAYFIGIRAMDGTFISKKFIKNS
jgi:hypothetical protein